MRTNKTGAEMLNIFLALLKIPKINFTSTTAHYCIISKHIIITAPIISSYELEELNKVLKGCYYQVMNNEINIYP